MKNIIIIFKYYIIYIIIMINNKEFIYKNITNNKNIQLIFSNDSNYQSIKKLNKNINSNISNNDISLNNIFINNITNLINKSLLYEDDIICIVSKENKEECIKIFENTNIKNKYDIYTFKEISQIIHTQISKLHYKNRKHKTRFTNKNKDKYNKNKNKYNKNNKEYNLEIYNNKIINKNIDKKQNYIDKQKHKSCFKNKNALMNIHTIKDTNIDIFNNKTILINQIYTLIKLKDIKKRIKKATYNCKRIII